jgi:MftR C-terminal domain
VTTNRRHDVDHRFEHQPCPHRRRPQCAQRLVSNLLDNAIHHNHDNGQITVTTGRGAERSSFQSPTPDGSSPKPRSADFSNPFSNSGANAPSIETGMASGSPSSPRGFSELHALRVALRTVFGALSVQEATDQRERVSLIFSVRELRSTLLDQLVSTMELLSQVLAERTGQPPDNVGLRTLSGAVIGVAMAVMVSLAKDPTADIGALLDESMAHLEVGLDI